MADDSHNALDSAALQSASEITRSQTRAAEDTRIPMDLSQVHVEWPTGRGLLVELVPAYLQRAALKGMLESREWELHARVGNYMRLVHTALGG